ncbi:MAG: 2-C-methyl-D-erythritol 2,4-cyclodiphosphate synthase [Candidatus Aureabacteria bacterium]|nr:2-C-methyl-D-erythritol 2,4-cyclodiphosphate synthase [Candidatus Auribacterota bacterium]
MSFRTGSGFDLHRIVPGRKMILGGVDIPYDRGFLGHSDGDVLVHSVCSALLGAAGMKDLGTYFPDTDPKWKNADSLRIILPEVHQMIAKRFSVYNLDITVVMEKPKLAPYIDSIKKNLARTLQLDVNRIAVKATRTEECFLIPPNEAALVLVSLLLREKRTVSRKPDARRSKTK